MIFFMQYLIETIRAKQASPIAPAHPARYITKADSRKK